jgi:hypothetical protein
VDSAVDFKDWTDSMSQPQAKPLRQTMPTVAAWVDELREAFGADAINDAIRNGVAGGSAFHAMEGGHSIGTSVDLVPYVGRVSVSLADMVVLKSEKAGAR